MDGARTRRDRELAGPNVLSELWPRLVRNRIRNDHPHLPLVANRMLSELLSNLLTRLRGDTPVLYVNVEGKRDAELAIQTQGACSLHRRPKVAATGELELDCLNAATAFWVLSP